MKIVKDNYRVYLEEEEVEAIDTLIIAFKELRSKIYTYGNVNTRLIISGVNGAIITKYNFSDVNNFISDLEDLKEYITIGEENEKRNK